MPSLQLLSWFGRPRVGDPPRLVQRRCRSRLFHWNRSYGLESVEEQGLRIDSGRYGFASAKMVSSEMGLVMNIWRGLEGVETMDRYYFSSHGPALPVLAEVVEI